MTRDLLEWREHFPALDDCCHLVSHSLGCMPQAASTAIDEFLELWRQDSIEAWHQWLPEVDRAARRIEQLLSAPAGTVVMNTNCSAVMSVLASCFEYTPERNKIVYTSMQFPTVSYVWMAETRRGAKVHIVESDDGIRVDTEKLMDAIDEHTVAVPISHVLFGSAYIQDVRAICAKANSVGAHVILDCYQSLAAIPVDIVELGVSFACGGSVKYLCGGPGAAYLYVRKDLIGQFEPRVTGWFGNESPFSFTMPEQSYADTIWRYMGGTPAVIALYQARAGAKIICEIGVQAIREKSLCLTRKIIEICRNKGFAIGCPDEDAVRGGSVVFNFSGAAEVACELNRRKFYCDHRPGRGIRVGPHFYTKEEEIDAFFAELVAVRENKRGVSSLGGGAS